MVAEGPADPIRRPGGASREEPAQKAPPTPIKVGGLPDARALDDVERLAALGELLRERSFPGTVAIALGLELFERRLRVGGALLRERQLAPQAVALRGGAAAVPDGRFESPHEQLARGLAQRRG